jgi:hypothetical protein
VNPEQEPKRNDSECPQDWRAARFNPRIILDRAAEWFADQSTLMEAFWVAFTFQVLLFPVLWIMGWALPWPHAMSKTTVVEIDLSNWPYEAKVPTKKHKLDIQQYLDVPKSKPLPP